MSKHSIRGTAFAISNTVGRSGAIISPMLAELLPPEVVLVIYGVFGILATLFFIPFDSTPSPLWLS